MTSRIVFDLDGTLIDPSARDYAVYHDILTKMGHPCLPFHTYWPLRRECTNLVELLAMTVPDAASIMEEYVPARIARIESTEFLALDTVFPNVLSVLGLLCIEHECHIVTSRSSMNRARTLSQLEAFGISKFLTSVVIVHASKLHALRLLNHGHSVIAMVGDSELDIAPAKELKIKTIAVASGIRSRQFLERLEPDHVFDEIADVLGVL